VSILIPRDAHFERGGRAEGSPGPSPSGPVLHEPRPTGLTYETFYGLKEKPFSLSSDFRFFYHSRSHAPAYDDLLAGIRRRESLNVLTGDIGTGKTTLCRAVLQNLDRKTFSAFVPDPFASRKDLLKVLLMDFGVVSVDDLTSGRLKDASRTELSYLLYEFLDTLTPLQAFAVVIIDEAQNLSVPLLEEIRILSDSDGRERQLQVVLVGQLELREKLKLPEMRQVDQRVSVHCTLEPLGRDGVAGFVSHRLQVAGGSPDRIRFSPEAIEAVYDISGGVPRLINRICDRALQQAHSRRVGTIDREIVEAAIPDRRQFSPTPPPAPAIAPAPPAAAAPAAPTSPAAPAVTETPAPAAPDPIDQWLMAFDEDRSPEPAGVGAPAAPAPPAAPDLARPQRLVVPPAAAERDRKPAPKGSLVRAKLQIKLTGPTAGVRQPRPVHRHRTLPRTHMQQFTRRWARRLGIAMVCVTALPVAAAAGISLWSLSTDLWEQTAPPASPHLPPARPLVQGPALRLPAPPETLSPDAAVTGGDRGSGLGTPK
jgi:type II secretory pathway predicted ATPase ExeA